MSTARSTVLLDWRRDTEHTRIPLARPGDDGVTVILGYSAIDLILSDQLVQRSGPHCRLTRPQRGISHNRKGLRDREQSAWLPSSRPKYSVISLGPHEGLHTQKRCTNESICVTNKSFNEHI